MSKRDSLLAIDYVKNVAGGTSRVVSGGGGTVDTSGFLLLDGSRAMSGNLDMGGFNINNVNLLDGVDLPAHVANANAHHNRQHTYDSTLDHTGTLSWVNVNKAGSNLTDIVTRAHSSLQGIGPNDHHNRSHSITSASDHTVTGSAFDLVGLNATNTLAILTPSADVQSGVEKILKSTSAGNLGLASLTTSLINSTSGSNLQLSPDNYLTFSPANYLVRVTSGVAIQSDNYSSQTTGMRVDHSGNGDFRYLFTDEMHAKSFIVDLEQALAGGQIISKSVAILYQDFITPAAGAPTTLVVRDLPGTTNMAAFVNGDVVRLRNFSRAGGSLSITDCWGTVVLDTTYGTSGFDSNTKTQRYTFTRSSGSDAGAMATSTVVSADTLVLDYGTSGNGYYEVNAIDGSYGINSPYSQTVIWTGHPATGRLTTTRLGNLNGIFSTSGEYGLYAGTGTTDASSYLRVSNTQVGIYNVPLRMFTGSTETVHIGGWNDVWIGPSSADRRINWNGSTLTITGVVSIQAGSAGYGNLSGIPTSLADVNPTEGSKLTGIATGATKNTLYRQTTDPGGSNGDFWYDTDANPPVLYQKVSGSWQVASNYVTNTNQVTDGANLGGTSTWTGVSSKPTRFSFESTPTGQAAQLFLAANAMGYWDGFNWRTYMDALGRFYFLGASGAVLAWDGTRLFGGTTTTFSTTNANWYIDSTNGSFVAGQGQVYITKDAVNLTWDGTYLSSTYGAASKFRWYLTASTSSTLLATLSITDAPLAYSSSIHPASRETSLRLLSGTSYFTGLYASNSTGSQSFIITSQSMEHLGSGFWYMFDSSGITFRSSYLGSLSGQLYMSGANFGTTSGGIAGSARATNWFRSIGATGWYSETYGGGWYMTDTTWLRAYNNKYIYTTGAIYGGYILAGTSTVGAYQLDVSGEAHVTGSIRADVALSLKATTPPGTSAVYAVVFVDSADGDLKVKFTNGVTRTLAVN